MAGPGAELGILLKRFGIRPGKKCKCRRQAQIMDERGPGWCRENIEKLVDWLQREAKKRRLPFHRRIGRYLVNRAIKNSLRSGEA